MIRLGLASAILIGLTVIIHVGGISLTINSLKRKGLPTDTRNCLAVDSCRLDVDYLSHLGDYNVGSFLSTLRLFYGNRTIALLFGCHLHDPRLWRSFVAGALASFRSSGGLERNPHVRPVSKCVLRNP